MTRAEDIETLRNNYRELEEEAADLRDQLAQQELHRDELVEVLERTIESEAAAYLVVAIFERLLRRIYPNFDGLEAELTEREREILRIVYPGVL